MKISPKILGMAAHEREKIKTLVGLIYIYFFFELCMQLLFLDHDKERGKYVGASKRSMLFFFILKIILK